MVTGTAARPLRLALGVLAAAGLVVVGLLLGASLTASAAPDVPDEASVDAGFARDMQVHHGQAVEMSVLVRDRSDDPDVLGLALDILLTQQNQQGQMAGWLSTWGLRQSSTLPVMAWMSAAAEHGSHSGMAGMEGMEGMAGMERMGLATEAEMAALAAADGVAAERLYLQLMLDHHRGGVQMAEVAAEHATQPHVRRLAEGMVAGQRAEIARLDELLQARGGPVEG